MNACTMYIGRRRGFTCNSIQKSNDGFSRLGKLEAESKNPVIQGSANCQ